MTVEKAAVQLRKQENNCFRLQYNLVVTSKLILNGTMADLILTCTVCIPPTREGLSMKRLKKESRTW